MIDEKTRLRIAYIFFDAITLVSRESGIQLNYPTWQELPSAFKETYLKEADKVIAIFDELNT